jgi:DNA primase
LSSENVCDKFSVESTIVNSQPGEKMGKNSRYLDYISALRGKADIVQVIRSEGVRLKNRGRFEMVGLSPFVREKTPSLVVNHEKQVFRCFSSGKGGTVFSFLMYTRDISFEGAVRILATRYRFGYRRWRDERKRDEECMRHKEGAI